MVEVAPLPPEERRRVTKTIEALQAAKEAAQEEMDSVQQGLKRLADLRELFGGRLPEVLQRAEERLAEQEKAWRDARDWADGELRK